MNTKKQNRTRRIIEIAFTVIVIITTYYIEDNIKTINISEIPAYKDKPYVIINDNVPEFTETDYTNEPFEEYSELDSLGRCGVAFANICTEIMPKKGEKREDIGSIKPSRMANNKI